MKMKHQHPIALILLGLCLISSGTGDCTVNAQPRIHTVYFEDTDYELHVYRIHGHEPGKTLMIIGGIQGDEPVAYLAADLFVDFFLARGNLIVVPRANFQSIMLNQRQINEDMNRKFSEDVRENYETKIVGILKKLMAESDCLLNLHEGSGFYSETWEGPYRNPMRYGQSIIADAETYMVPGTGATLLLGDMARAVIDRMNPQIQNPDHYFRFNNHRTDAVDSLHKEQRKSATYYALYTCGIPAFGIEASKTLPLETKVRHHRLAIKGFMEILDIVPEIPGIQIEQPALRYAVVSINDEPPVLLSNRQTLSIKRGDCVTVSHVEANYLRGLSADIIDHGGLNDLRKRLAIHKATSIMIRKDGQSFGEIYLAMKEDPSPSIAGASSWPKEDHVHDQNNTHDDRLFFDLRINGQTKLFRNNEHVSLVRGDMLQIVDVIWGTRASSELVVNFKGFVGKAADNTGEDRGYIIDTGGNLLTRHSVDHDGKCYPVVVTDRENREVGILFIELEDPAVRYAVFRFDGKENRCCRVGETLVLKRGRVVELVDLISNVENLQNIETVLIRNAGNAETPVRLNTVLEALCDETRNGGDRYRLHFRRNHISMGHVSITCESGETHD